MRGEAHIACHPQSASGHCGEQRCARRDGEAPTDRSDTACAGTGCHRKTAREAAIDFENAGVDLGKTPGEVRPRENQRAGPLLHERATRTRHHTGKAVVLVGGPEREAG